MANVRERVERLEVAPAAAASSSSRQLLLLNSLDIARRRISFIFAEVSTKEKREAVTREIGRKFNR
eukprot:14502631-Alexandrium_andersonii.AAC.1